MNKPSDAKEEAVDNQDQQEAWNKLKLEAMQQALDLGKRLFPKIENNVSAKGALHV